MTQLPKWEDHVGHNKFEPLTHKNLRPMRPYVRQYLSSLGDKSALRILDFGCGRGDVVGTLCLEGWDAFGVDVVPEYIAIGQAFLESAGFPLEKVSLASTFEPKEMFDVIISEQVIEHIDDLDAAVAFMASVTAPGGRGLHVLPSRWSLIEAHYKIPTAHWWPGVVRRVLLHISVRLGIGSRVFRSYSASDQVAIIDEFAARTFYRSERNIKQAFMEHGFVCDFVTPNRHMVAHRLPACCRFATRPIAWCVRHVLQTAFSVTKK